MKLLDCTLRDGGYYTEWDFAPALVDTYIESFNSLPVEYLEIGYRSLPMKGYLGEYFYCPEYVVEQIYKKTNKKLAIILNEKDVRDSDAEALLMPVKPYIAMVRIAVDPENFLRAIDLGKAIKRIGFELCFNVMYMSKWHKYPELMDNLNLLEGLADYLYMVDSYGGVYPDDVKAIINTIRGKTQIPLGFHGHNNLELALINSLTALEHGVEIIDATVTGMGRGAGNLKTELLLSVLQSKYNLEFDYNYLSKVTDAFSRLQLEHGWGTNLPYMVSGANSLPQKQVMEWVSKRFYSFNSIIRALSNQSKGIEDNHQLPKLMLAESEKSNSILIVGGGPSVAEHARAISEFLKGNPQYLVIHASSRNAMVFKELPNKQYFCLVGNEGHRLEEVFKNADLISGKFILPPFPRKMGTYIPSTVLDRSFELNAVNFTEKLKDTHTSLAIQTVLELGAKEVFVVGYDGYSGSSIGQKEQDFFFENEYLFQKASEAGLKLVSLTRTRYSNLLQGTLYAKV